MIHRGHLYGDPPPPRVSEYGYKRLFFFKEQAGKKITSALSFDEAGYLGSIVFEVIQ